MSYMVASVIYGIPWTAEMQAAAAATGHEDMGAFGFMPVYTGGDAEEGYLGVSIGEFDEASGPIPFARLARMVARLTDGKKARAKKKLAGLPEWLRKVAPKPAVYIIFGSS